MPGLRLAAVAVITSFLFSASASISQEGRPLQFPKVKDGDIALFAIAPDQLKYFLAVENFSTTASPGGNCYGLDRLNQFLVTHRIGACVKDEEVGSPIPQMMEEISEASCLTDFSNQVRLLADKGTRSTSAFLPIVEELQSADSSSSKAIEWMRAEVKSSVFEEDAHAMVQRIYQSLRVGRPVPIGIANFIFRYAHALTIYGMIVNPDHLTFTFYAFDTNRPEEFQKLQLLKHAHTNDWTWQFNWGTPRKLLAFLKGENVDMSVDELEKLYYESTTRSGYNSVKLNNRDTTGLSYSGNSITALWGNGLATGSLAEVNKALSTNQDITLALDRFDPKRNRMLPLLFGEGGTYSDGRDKMRARNAVFRKQIEQALQAKPTTK